MKKLVIALLATLALAVVVALPASATSKEPTGTAFHMLQGTPTTFTVGAAFYIGNCWLVDTSTTKRMELAGLEPATSWVRSRRQRGIERHGGHR